MFISLNSVESMDEKIKGETFTFFFISQPNCSVCVSLHPQTERISAEFPRIHCYSIDIADTPEIAGAFHVFTAPTLLLFIDGKEYMREARFVQTEVFKNKLARIYHERLDLM